MIWMRVNKNRDFKPQLILKIILIIKKFGKIYIKSFSICLSMS